MNRIVMVLSIIALLSQMAQAEQVRAFEPQTGAEIFEKWCLSCHGKGNDYPGTMALAARYKGAVPAALEDRTDLTASTIEYFVRNGISVMPFFRKTEISDKELQKLSTYLTEQEH